jgi:hypothetical protein
MERRLKSNTAKFFTQNEIIYLPLSWDQDGSRKEEK